MGEGRIVPPPHDALPRTDSTPMRDRLAAMKDKFIEMRTILGVGPEVGLGSIPSFLQHGIGKQPTALIRIGKAVDGSIITDGTSFLTMGGSDVLKPEQKKDIVVFPDLNQSGPAAIVSVIHAIPAFDNSALEGFIAQNLAFWRIKYNNQQPVPEPIQAVLDKARGDDLVQTSLYASLSGYKDQVLIALDYSQRTTKDNSVAKSCSRARSAVWIYS